MKPTRCSALKRASIVVLAWLALAAPVMGMALEASELGACTEPVVDPAVAPAPRLVQLRYSCLKLANGRHVLVGEAGAMSAPTVLLVHGLGNNAHRDWALTVPALTEKFHVIALDLPGFGASQAAPQGYSFSAFAQTLAGVLDRAAPGQRVHVVGHSLGGAVSLHFAHTYPDRVDRLVLVDAAGILFKTVFAHHIASVRSPQVGVSVLDRFLKGVDDRINNFSRSLLYGLDDRFDLSRWLVQNPSVRYALLGPYTQVDAALGLVEHNFTPAIRETLAPTTVIWGRDDPVAPLRTAGLLAARMPDARLRVIDGAGHTPMLEAPAAFNRLLLEALALPLAPKYASAATGAFKGDVVCRNLPNQHYSGRFGRVTLENCADARITGAALEQLTLKSSSVTIEDSIIDSKEVALVAQQSEVTATAVQLRGRVAIQADDSRFDLAGVSLQATQRGVDMVSPSRFFFSVSDWHGSDRDGDAHFFWPPAGTAP